MGRAVIRQPDGLYAVFSSGTDQWVAWDLTREQYIDRRVEEVAREARADAARLLDDTDAGLVYAGYTFGEANAESVEHGGEGLTEPCEWLAIWIGPHRHLLKDDGRIGIVVERLAGEDVARTSGERIQAYGRGEFSGDQLTGEELEQATDGLDALDWAP